MSGTSGKKRKLLIIGPSPKSFGGVAIHIRRLAILMQDEFDISYIDEGRERFEGFFNLRSLNLFKYLNFIIKADDVYINSGLFFLRIFHIMVCKILLRKKTIVAIHHDVTRERMILLTKFFVKKCDTLLVVNQTTEKIFKNCVKNLIYLSAFIPPNIEQEPELPQEVIDWCMKCRNNKYAVLLVSNAWNLVTHNGYDLYGLDLCIEAMKLLLDKGKKNFYLVFVVASNTSNQDMMAGYKRFIKNNNLEENILIWESPLSFVRLIQKCDIVLRATNTDGEALTIREAFCFNKKVVASDVIPRPTNTFLFKNRDSSSLANAIEVAANCNNHLISDDHTLDYYKKFYLEIFNN